MAIKPCFTSERWSVQTARFRKAQSVVGAFLVSDCGVSDQHARNGLQSLDMKRRAAQTSAEHKLTEEVSGSFFGINPSGHQVMVIPTTADRAPLDRATGSVTISFREKVLFELRKTKFE